MRDARIGRRVDDAPLDGLDGEFNGLRFVDLVKIEGDHMTFVGVRETANENPARRRCCLFPAAGSKGIIWGCGSVMVSVMTVLSL